VLSSTHSLAAVVSFHCVCSLTVCCDTSS